MRKHGKGPSVYVRVYLRWQRGVLRRVCSYERPHQPKPHFLRSILQLDFGF